MTTELPMFQIDAFAEQPFAGNPAAVVPLQEWLDGDVMQSIALENNLSETAFFVRTPEAAEADYHLRWFTPALEVDLCGHATLAAASVLFDNLGFAGDAIRFRTHSGILTVRRNGTHLELDFPARVAQAMPVPTGFEEAHGVAPGAFLRATKNMAVLEDEAAVRDFKPDLNYIASLEGDGLIVTAPGATCHVASRYFAPAAGIPEDPVTGSAHCTIVPYWCERLGVDDLHCKQVSSRGGDLYCRMEGDRVRISGRARLFMAGHIMI